MIDGYEFKNKIKREPTMNLFKSQKKLEAKTIEKKIKPQKETKINNDLIE